ncbi:hypothetical protein PSV08DRAFT_250907 [Bipolaris maydis]|uniref:uncharacterized protein n=1 Tax=Cochliobolus heterostrophus TaxID=5016 RepID=UPI0024DDE7AA|nr:hypothetical protein PSV08DRAFT_250907 [Bipolaris maydis]
MYGRAGVESDMGSECGWMDGWVWCDMTVHDWLHSNHIPLAASPTPWPWAAHASSLPERLCPSISALFHVIGRLDTVMQLRGRSFSLPLWVNHLHCASLTTPWQESYRSSPCSFLQDAASEQATRACQSACALALPAYPYACLCQIVPGAMGTVAFVMQPVGDVCSPSGTASGASWYVQRTMSSCTALYLAPALSSYHHSGRLHASIGYSYRCQLSAESALSPQ